MTTGQLTTGQATLQRWSTPDGPWTEPDLHRFPQDGHRYEIVEGSLHVTPPLGDNHERVVHRLITALRAAAPDGWRACARLGVRIGQSCLIPDVTVLRPGSSGGTWIRPSDIALVVEVESPTTRGYDRHLKSALYADAGIPMFWRVEWCGDTPEAKLHVLAPNGYRLEHTVLAGVQMTVVTPYGVTVTPATWI